MTRRHLFYFSFFIFHFSFFISPTIQAQYVVTNMGKTLNTSGSETGAVRAGDTVLVYSSMPRNESGNKQFSFDNAQMRVMQSRIARSGKLSRPKPCRWGINSKRDHTGNVCLDPVSHDLYFTRARLGDPTLRSEIWYAHRLKRGWDKPQRLRGDINGRDYSCTQPTVGRLADGTAVLYYASNRTDGMGGMDIWYAIVADGTAQQSVNLGPQVNSPYDELTPFYDQPSGVLYFSSDRPGGLGGLDIYCSVGARNTWQKAEHTCECLNSQWNDIYFVVTDHDPQHGIPLAGYLSSNRPHEDDSTACCNDLYSWSIDSVESEKWKEESMSDTSTDTAPGNLSTPHSPLSTFMFPLFLYFHNDEPDPGSHEASTAASYADCQRRYAAMRAEYVSRQPDSASAAMMNLFFDTCVEGNYRRVEALFDYIEEQLDEGRSATLTVAGYASPLHRSDYNQTLSERRIASFINMIREWRGGLFANAIDDGRLIIVQHPRGVDTLSPLSTHPSPQNDPVYSLPAAQARRIEIISCEIAK